MAFSLKEFVFGGKTFCCCLPVRFGVIAMSFLSLLFSGALSVVLWFEVANPISLTAYERRIFIVAGLVETFLLTASIFGFVGAIVRKQLFVMIYAYFIYGHFILNIIIAIILLSMIIRAEQTDIVKACKGAIQNPQAQAQCSGLLQLSEGVFIGSTIFVLLVELYCAIIIARFVRQLRSEKRHSSRMAARGSGFKLLSIRSSYAPLHDSYDTGLPEDGLVPEFDPYEHYPTDYSSLQPPEGSYDDSSRDEVTLEDVCEERECSPLAAGEKMGDTPVASSRSASLV